MANGYWLILNKNILHSLILLIFDKLSMILLVFRL